MLSSTLMSAYPPKHSARYDWRGPMAECPAYRLQPSCLTIFSFWEMPAHDLLQEGENVQDAFTVEYLPPPGDYTPAALVTACEWIVPGTFTW